MMCLASKVRVLCGKADSPTLCARTFRQVGRMRVGLMRVGLKAVDHNFWAPQVIERKSPFVWESGNEKGSRA